MGFSIGKVFRPIEEEMRKYAEVDSVYMPVPNYSIKGLWKNIMLARKVLKQKNYDIIHITGTEHYLLPFLTGVRKVVTVHDIGSLNVEKRDIYAKIKKALFVDSLKCADMVTCISEQCKQELSDYNVLKKNKYVVIPDAYDQLYCYYPQSFNSEKPRVLHIGTKDNKNLIMVIKALEEIPVHLHIVGRLTEEQKEALLLSKIEYSNNWNISDNQILEEYKKCDIVSFPSLYEGFGMPIIEGQAIGRVVVTSNIEPMNSVAGNGAVKVNPHDVKSVREGFKKAIMDYEYFIRSGIENSKRFSLDKVVLQYKKVYQQLC